MKKYLLAAVAAIVASGAANASESFSGAYAGLQVGQVSTHVDYKVGSQKVKLGAQAVGGNIVAGYGQVFDSLYAGLELSAGLDGTNDKLVEDNNTSINMKSREVFGASARFGYLLTQKAMVFISLGVNSQKNQYTLKGLGIDEQTFSGRDVSFVPGIGTQIAVAENVGFRAEFTSDLGKTRTINFGSADHKLKTSKSSFKVGLVYTF